jgi:hypothetical protein
MVAKCHPVKARCAGCGSSDAAALIAFSFACTTADYHGGTADRGKRIHVVGGLEKRIVRAANFFEKNTASRVPRRRYI